MKFKKLIRGRYAVSGVIEALLLVALVAIIISLIQLIYIPDIMEQKEAEHMDEVSNQFSYLKSMIDIQTITESDVPIFSMITLGSRELPYFVTARAFGELTLIDNDDYRIEINYAPVATLTSIKYVAYNSYFVDQTYVLEGGGIIVDQAEGESVMRVDPAVSATIGADIDISFDLPMIAGIPGKNTTYGYGRCFVRTNYSSSVTQPPYASVASIQIFTEYPNAWNASLSDLLGDFVTITKESDHVEIEPNGIDINVYIKEITINAQVSPGWIV